jgi:hypothetical protein
MAFIRLLLTSLLAALAGSAIGSVLLFGELSRGSFVTFPVTSAGSILLLSPLYAAAREGGVSVGGRYARLLIAGGVTGGLLLGFISHLTNPLKGTAIGAAYGVFTAICWVAVHATMKRLFAALQ